MTEEIQAMKEGMSETMEIIEVIRSVETDATRKALHAAVVAYGQGIRDGAKIAAQPAA